MELKDQVCSLELAKELKQLGVKQESLYFWVNLNREGDKESYIWKTCNTPQIIKNYIASAFTVSEIGEILKWELLMIFGLPDDFKKFIDGETSEADARAKMLIYSIEKKSAGTTLLSIL